MCSSLTFNTYLLDFCWDSLISIRWNWAQKYSIRLTVTEKESRLAIYSKELCNITLDCFHNAYRVLFGLFSLIWVLLHHHICVDKLSLVWLPSEPAFLYDSLRTKINPGGFFDKPSAISFKSALALTAFRWLAILFPGKQKSPPVVESDRERRRMTMVQGKRV